MTRALIGFFALALPLLAETPDKGFEALLQKGHDHYFNLEYDEAIAAYRQATEIDPDNPRLYNHIAAATLFKELNRLGMLETSAFKGDNKFLDREKPQPDPEVRRAVLNAIEKSRELAKARLKKDPDDKVGLFAMATTYGLQANYEFMVDKSYFAALRNGQRARKYSNRLYKKHRDFVDGRLIAGVQEYVVGSLPWAVRALVALGGVRGSKVKGERMVTQVAERGDLLRNEARVLLTLLYRRERRPLKAAEILEGLMRDFPRNYVLRLELASMYLDANEKARALEVFQTTREMVRTGQQRHDRMPQRLRKALDRKIEELEKALDGAPAPSADSPVRVAG